MLGRAQERVRLRLELLDADPRVGCEDACRKRAHVRVVARVVLGHQLGEPTVIALVCSFPRLALPQLGLRFGHRYEPPENEVELDRHRLLAPQRTVVVEHCYPLVGGHSARRLLDELDDRLPHRAVVPARQRLRHRTIIGGRYVRALAGLRPSSRTARSASTQSIPIAIRVSRVALPRWGASTTFSSESSASETSGSRS